MKWLDNLSVRRCACVAVCARASVWLCVNNNITYHPGPKINATRAKTKSTIPPINHTGAKIKDHNLKINAPSPKSSPQILKSKPQVLKVKHQIRKSSPQNPKIKHTSHCNIYIYIYIMQYNTTLYHIL